MNRLPHVLCSCLSSGALKPSRTSQTSSRQAGSKLLHVPPPGLLLPSSLLNADVLLTSALSPNQNVQLRIQIIAALPSGLPMRPNICR